MAHVITGSCCNDAACVAACPVNCIHPTPEEREYLSSELLYIDPEVCIDCGACADVCPVNAIVADYDLEVGDEPFAALNAAWYSDPSRASYSTTPTRPNVLVTQRPGPLRVAVVGTGPAAAYVVDALLSIRGLVVEITVVERLLTPGGLVRYGVAPDHAETKAIGDGMNRTLRKPGVSVWLGVEFGADVSAHDLLSEHHAVVVASGTAGARALGIPGESLAGVHSAADFVGWYNGHPDHADRTFDLATKRAVVVGNGNVALDVARVLLTPYASLRSTDIAAPALEAIAKSEVREVVIVGRRGVHHAAFTAGELIRLGQEPGLDLLARGAEMATSADDPITRYKVDRLSAIADASARATSDRRVVFRFGLRPTEVRGAGRVTSLALENGTGEEEIATGLLISAIGYRAAPVPGLPFDAERAVVPNILGRVAEGSGLYVAGWLKRGPSGGIGTNKWCALETVATLVADHEAGKLPDPPRIDGRVILPGLGLAAWDAIDRYERDQGRAVGRPRVKTTSEVEQRLIGGNE